MKKISVLALLVSAMAALAADEITLQVAFRIADNYIDQQRAQSSTFTVTNTTPNFSGGSVVVATNAAGTAITFGDVVVPGMTWFRNLSATNTGNVIAIGVRDASTNFLEFARVKPGEFQITRIGTNAIYARSMGTNETSSRLEKLCVDD